MQLLKLKTKISKFDTFSAFVEEFKLSHRDLIITSEFLYEPFMKDMALPCHFVMQEQYGNGEPSDEMMNRILSDVQKVDDDRRDLYSHQYSSILSDIQKIDYDRVIAIGGGSVIDIAKLFVLKDVKNVTAAFERKMPIQKDKALVIIPILSLQRHRRLNSCYGIFRLS